MIEKDNRYFLGNEYGIQYLPEEFSIDRRVELDGLSESDCLKPFFSNLNRSVFTINNLPEEVVGALSSRYSRATNSLRRIFFDEYLRPILLPEEGRDWNQLTKKQREILLGDKKKAIEYIKYLNNPENSNNLVNIEKGREFFEKWLLEFGDDSIAEQAGIHLCVEGASNIVVNAIESQRIGLSYIEKSTRYVSYDKKDREGRFLYAIPDIDDPELREVYIQIMNEIFKCYEHISPLYLQYIKEKYPIGDDEDLGAFNRSRSAKRFDDLRELLPFGTQTNVAIHGNARAMEHMVQRLQSHPLSEVRQYGKIIGEELTSAMPSLFKRINTEKGRRVVQYKSDLNKLFDDSDIRVESEISSGVKLVSHDNDGEDRVIASLLFTFNKNPLPYSYYLEKVKQMSEDKKKEILGKVFSLRGTDREKDRFLSVPGSFEKSTYLFEIVSRGGDFRDLLRHRMSMIERPLFSTNNGFELDPDLENSDFIGEIKDLFTKVNNVYQRLKEYDPNIAQYVVPFGFLQHWTFELTAKEIYYVAELRSGPQGKSSYRKIVQEMVRLCKEVHPLLFEGILVDNNEYSLSRRESEIKRSKNLNY